MSRHTPEEYHPVRSSLRSIQLLRHSGGRFVLRIPAQGIRLARNPTTQRGLAENGPAPCYPIGRQSTGEQMTATAHYRREERGTSTDTNYVLQPAARDRLNPAAPRLQLTIGSLARKRHVHAAGSSLPSLVREAPRLGLSVDPDEANAHRSPVSTHS